MNWPLTRLYSIEAVDWRNTQWINTKISKSKKMKCMFRKNPTAAGLIVQFIYLLIYSSVVDYKATPPSAGREVYQLQFK